MDVDEMRQFIEFNYPITTELLAVEKMSDEEVVSLFKDMTSYEESQ